MLDEVYESNHVISCKWKAVEKLIEKYEVEKYNEKSENVLN